MRGGKSTREPPFPQDVGTRQKAATASHTDAEDEVQEDAVDSNMFATLEDPALLFPEWIRKPVANKQFSKFVEVIMKLYVNIPLLDAMQVPMYAKYIKDILGNKRTLPMTKVV